MLDNQPQAAQGMQGVFSLVLILIMMAVVVVLAYLATRFIGRRYSFQGGGGRYIRVIDRMPVGQDMSLLIVRVAGRTLLIGAAQHGMRLLCELDGDGFPDPPETEPPPMPFQEMFHSILRRGRNEGNGEGGAGNGDGPGEE